MGRPRREDGKNSSTVASNKYKAKSYDRFSLIMYKGQKEMVKRYADEHGESVGGLINRLLAQEIPGFIPIGIKDDEREDEKAQSD